MSDLNIIVKDLARGVGFDLVGIAKANSPSEAKFFQKWLDAGFAGSMNYLTNRLEERLNLDKVLSGVKSVIVCGLAYNTKEEKSIDNLDQSIAWISRYAWGVDYHIVLKKMLHEFNELLQQQIKKPFQFKIYVDTGPVLEKVYAYRAGLGWFGKNSCLLNKELGSYFFLGVMLTDLEIESDFPKTEHCGTCSKCIDACPTGAIVAPKVVDSRKCISFQTIENHQGIPNSVRNGSGNNLYGCDICQEVCPWNDKATKSKMEEFLPSEHLFQPKIAELVEMISEKYPQGFAKSPLKRPKQKGLLRNLINVIGNSREKKYISLLNSIDHKNDQILIDSIDWAVSKLNQT